MALTYTNTVGNARLDAVRTALNTGGGGKLVIMTSALVTLVTINLEAVIGAAAGKVLTLISTAKNANAVAAGLAGSAKLTDNAGTTVCDGMTVATSGADVNLNDLNITNGALVTINSGTLTTL